MNVKLSFTMIQSYHYLVHFAKGKQDITVIKLFTTKKKQRMKTFLPNFIYTSTISVALDTSLKEGEFTIKEECVSIYNKILKDF